MSVLEMVRTKVKELTDPNGPANGLLQTAKTAVSHGLDGASKFVDEKTNGKYTSQINTGVHKAKEFLGEDKTGDAGGASSAENSAEGSAGASPTAPQAPEASSAPKPPESNEPPQP